MTKETNQCKDCKYGHTLRIHILTGDRNCAGGTKGKEKYHRHPPTGTCKDFRVFSLNDHEQAEHKVRGIRYHDLIGSPVRAKHNRTRK